MGFKNIYLWLVKCLKFFIAKHIGSSWLIPLAEDNKPYLETSKCYTSQVAHSPVIILSHLIGVIKTHGLGPKFIISLGLTEPGLFCGDTRDMFLSVDTFSLLFASQTLLFQGSCFVLVDCS